MEKEKLISQLEFAFKSANPTAQITNICRRFLKDEVRSSNMRDTIIASYLCEIIDHYEVTLAFEDSCQIARKVSRFPFLVAGITGIAGISLLFTDNFILRTIESVVAVGGSFLVGKELSNKSTTYSHTLKTTPEDIFDNLQKYSKVLRSFYEHSSLESCDKEVLRWLQKQYSESKDENFRLSIADVLSKCFYEFCPFSKESADFFEVTYGNITEPKTTSFAVKNIKTNDFVLHGHVIIPRID